MNPGSLTPESEPLTKVLCSLSDAIIRGNSIAERMKV